MAKGDTTDRRYDLDRVVRLVISAATLVAVVWLLRYLSDVLIPFAIALLLAYLLNPIVNALELRLKNRPAAVLVTVFGCLLVMTAGVLLLIPVIETQIADFEQMVADLRAEAIPKAATTEGGSSGDAQTSETMAEEFDRFIAAQKNTRVKWILEQVRGVVTSEAFNPGALLLELGKRAAPGLWGVVSGAVSFLLGLTGLIVLLLYMVFLLNDFRHVERTWKDQLPPAYREPLVQFLDEFRDAMGRYFRGQFVIAGIVAILLAIGFSLIGLRMGILLGLFLGVLNMVPYAQIVGLVPAGLLAIIRAVEHDSSIAMSLLLVAIVFGVVQLIQDALLTPRILGKTTGLRPAIILLSVFVWGKLLGFLGIVLAIPLTCLGLAYYRRFVLSKAACRSASNGVAVSEPRP